MLVGQGVNGRGEGVTWMANASTEVDGMQIVRSACTFVLERRPCRFVPCHLGGEGKCKILLGGRAGGST